MRDFLTENEAYHRDHSHLGSSMISDWLDWRNPAEWADRYVFGRSTAEPPPDDRLLGTLIHLALMSPGAFKSSVAVIPSAVGRRGTPIYSDWEARIRAEKPGAMIIRQPMLETIKACRRAVLAHELASALVGDKRAVFESEYRWADHRAGVRCKIKPDILIDRKLFCIDVKTTRLPRPDHVEFTREAYKLGYHRSAAFQLEGLETQTRRDWEFLYLVVSTSSHRVFVHGVERPYVERGRIENEAARAEIGSCYESGTWPDPSKRVERIGSTNGRYRR